MKLPILLLAVVAIATSHPHKEPLSDNHGAQVLRVSVTNMASLRFMVWLQQNTRLDFWTEPRQLGDVDVMARRWDLPELKMSLLRRDLKYSVVVSDVAKLINQADDEQKKAKANSSRMDWTSYHDYDEIMDWLDEIAATHPDIATITDVGTSYEGRTMKLLKLSTGGEGKEVIFTDGGIHAREWISPATVTYIIDQIVSGHDDGILDSVDLYFMPSINPDGYAYTFTDNRLWRKTRSVSAQSACRGVDANRNWDFHWMEAGASPLPCSEVYAGPEPFSEVEMRHVRDVLLDIKPRVYLTFHSYSQLWLYPWGWTSDLPENWEDLDSLARDAVEALTAVYGTKYEIGSSTNTVYIAAGGSDDWCLGVGGSEYAYTIELRDKGLWGFMLPPNQIKPSGVETYEGFKVVANFVADNPTKKI